MRVAPSRNTRMPPAGVAARPPPAPHRALVPRPPFRPGIWCGASPHQILGWHETLGWDLRSGGVSGDEISDLAERLFRAFERNDTDAILGCCEPDARFFQNGKGGATVTELLPGFATMSERIGHHRYSDGTTYSGGIYRPRGDR